jgi:ADP-ribose pyrophosphatase YjhB (NUDIX family)
MQRREMSTVCDRVESPVVCRVVDFPSVTPLREEALYTSDEPRDTGFNTNEFARPSCSPIEHRLPRVVVRCIAQHKRRVLLCQRADEPRRELWNTPGGFLESGETLRTAVVRETLEESGISLEALRLGFVYEFPQLNEIVMTFLAEILDPRIAPGKESLDARLFEIASIPWRQLAFPTDSDALRLTFQHSPVRRRHTQIVECFWDVDGRIFAR